jgi:hypothetical protein
LETIDITFKADNADHGDEPSRFQAPINEPDKPALPPKDFS